MASDPEVLRNWRYYLLLEQDLEASFRYVEPDPRNDHVFSLEFVRQLAAVCAQFETVGRLFCEFKGVPLAKKDGINELRPLLLRVEPNLCDAVAVLRFRNQELRPFLEWQPKFPPAWWTAHNKVKHDPALHTSVATLANVRDALAALGLLTLMFVGSRDSSPSLSHLFDLTWGSCPLLGSPSNCWRLVA